MGRRIFGKQVSSFQIVILGFAAVILLGTGLLTLPAASRAGGWTSIEDALFTATSAVCVTGLVVRDTGAYWSFFGQAVILLLIQIGGLGIVTTLKTHDYRYLTAKNRAEAILMSSDVGADKSVYTNGRLRIDYSAGCAYLEGEELKLTPMEYRILCLLAKNTGKVLTHTFITQNIYGRNWDNDIASLRVFMTTLRKKIEPNPDSPKYIQTHIGIGYRMLKID